jgi:hypothetical protein
MGINSHKMYIEHPKVTNPAVLYCRIITSGAVADSFKILGINLPPTILTNVGVFKIGVSRSIGITLPSIFYCCFIQENLGHKKTPTILTNVGVFKIGVDLLSHPQKDSTISASRLNFSVRNGKRWTVLL